MKTSYILMIAGIITCACKSEGNKGVMVNNEPGTIKPVAKNTTSEGTYLCQINGKDWHYTKASGIVSRNKKTGKRTAIITFKKKLEKGSESVQLTYDGDSFELEKASVQLKFPKKDGGRVNGIYQLHPDTRDRNPESSLSGTINISDPMTASGNALLTKLNITWEKELLKNPDQDAIITVTDLKFSDVGYSDLTKAFESLKK